MTWSPRTDTAGTGSSPIGLLLWLCSVTIGSRPMTP